MSTIINGTSSAITFPDSSVQNTAALTTGGTITTGTITTLTTTTISDGTNITSSTNCIQGSAKAWVNYNASSQTITASYNVSSVTYTSTGNFTINFTNALVDTKYAPQITGSDIGYGCVGCIGTQTASAFTFFTYNNQATSNGNPTVTSVVIFR
jgi:hypothetical protein